MRFRLLLLLLVALLTLWALVPLVSSGQSGELSSIQSEIERKRRAIDAQKGRERAISRDIAGLSSRIDDVQGDITQLQRRLALVQADLDSKLLALARTQRELRSERARLVRLRRRLAEARVILAARLVELYKADKPDVLSVVLNADGFAQMLQRAEFAQRVADQDRRIIKAVRKAKAAAVASEARLQRLERDRRGAAATIRGRRDELATVRGRLVQRRDDFARARDSRSAVLQRVRFDRRESEQDLAALERQSARVTAKLRAASAAPQSLPAGPVRPGSGRLIWPVSGPITSPFGPRWGRLHAGIDIGAPEGTPIRAADSGTVALAGWEGAYGNYTCIQHGSGMATCYAHQSRIGVSSGQRVSRGDVIGAVGNTGRSFGAHLHFETRVGGTPQNPLNYL